MTQALSQARQLQETVALKRIQRSAAALCITESKEHWDSLRAALADYQRERVANHWG